MHELSLAANILDIISEKAPSKAAIRKVNVTVGPLAGIWTESLQFGFDELAREQGFKNARLCITKTEARLRCTACNNEYSADGLMEVCPSCGSLERTVLSGAEFTVDSIEMEE
ncbi:MAG: hypothetical protein GF401_12190 [Chitinivibrionales bacterium]|nr:hypothetical protein [Chitinivibrionales bacterium]